ncbi:phosphatase 2C [Musa troglodytarum]|uniref:protein-serine/threonine phosphatase n=1 Tax=Musa troglodytarum TaxID=320322 RepID=A0A9E7EJC2_9LILI|nr:phosphatase 2C [Musa troglodytarum]URD83555.1 phosphatase 2C [Musa troglodytarum]
MRQLSSLLNGLAKSLYAGKRKVPGVEEGRAAADELRREAKKNDTILRSSGSTRSCVSVFSQRGEKGVNQDCSIVWEEFGCQEDMMFCGIFDGHGSWGHYVSKQVRKSLPSSLLCNWQEALALASLVADKKPCQFDVWKQSYIKSCAAVDKELQHDRGLDSFRSGTTALTIVKQGELMVIANIGDSRAVLAMTSDDGNLVPVQLTVDFKPNLPQEAERITQCKGRVFCLQDEPGVHRVWLPNEEAPGLAMSRAFGDYCIKDFGLISVPEVSQRSITSRDQFVVLATDGVTATGFYVLIQRNLHNFSFIYTSFLQMQSI